MNDHAATLRDSGHADHSLDLVINALDYASGQTGTGAAHLADPATLRLEYAQIVQDHDGATTDEFRFDVYVNTNGAYTYVSTLAYDRDAPRHATGGVLVLLVPTVLSVYKPRGVTRYGRRRAAAGGAVPVERAPA